ncbi:BspA family leucine-rich repeat surface protein [Candidatus Saccharibacteria bacterium]|nr:BspA family leucine-rich repeat surface protein [Candidatus Saccharibacteria bacterium]
MTNIFGRNKKSFINPAYSSITLAVFCVLSLFLYPCFLPSRSYADTPEVTPNITIGNSGSLAFSVDPGSFAYGSQDITVLTTNYTGYTLTAVPSSNDSRLANSVTGSYIESIEDDAISSEFDANEYGFSTDSTITSSTTYHPVTTSTEIKRTNSATTTAQAGTFQLTIGAKAGSNTPAGTYSRTFTLTAAANPIAFAITYDKNAGTDTVSNMPASPQTTGDVSGTTLTLASNTPTRTGYMFFGWATTANAIEPDYQPGDPYSLDQTTGNIVTLYAVWIAPLQGWDDCNNLTIDSYKYLYDTRDNQIYRVTKRYMDSNQTPANARCWMMDNLNLGAETLVVNTLDSSNTHLPSNGSKNVPVTDSDADPTNDFTSWVKASGTYSFTNPDIVPITASNSGNGLAEDSYGNKYGALYNFAAASAGTYAYASNAGIDNAYYDICPSGWRLPTGGDSGEYKQFITDGYALSGSAGATYIQSTLKFPLAGRFHEEGTPDNQGTFGNYWTSTRIINQNMYAMYFSTSSVNPASDNNRRTGRSVRCIQQKSTHTLTVTYDEGVSSVTVGDIAVADGSTLQLEEGVSYSIDMTLDTNFEFDSWSATSGTLGSASTQSTTYTIGNSNATLTASAKIYMQDLTSSQCSTLASSSDLIVHDSRDQSDYTVRYLGGQCWMTQNLRITGTIPASGSNFSGSDFNVSQYDLTDSTHCTDDGASDSDPKGYTNVCSHVGVDNNGDSTAWYDYAAVTAGTIAGHKNTNDSTSDICPSGWRLPTSSEQSALVSAIGSSPASFNPVYGGNYYDGSLTVPSTYGRWWFSTAYDDHGRYNMNYYDGNLDINYGNRFFGRYIRCVKKNPTHTLTVSYGTGVASVTVNGQTVADGGTVTMEEGIPLSINMTFDTYYGFDSWSATSGTLGSTSTQNTTYTIGSIDATLTASALGDQSYLQFWDGCKDLPIGGKTTLVDLRDNQSYTVSRYKMTADGSRTACWLSNLNLGAASPALAVSELNSSNTNMPEGSTISSSAFSSWEKTVISTSQDDPQYIPVDGSDPYGNSYGTLYNFRAASALTYSSSTVSLDAEYDLCPKGWHMPTAGKDAGGELSILTKAYGITDGSVGTDGIAAQQNLGFSLAGKNGNDGTITDVGTTGHYWGSNHFGEYNGWRMYLRDDYVSPDYVINRTSALALRCTNYGNLEKEIVLRLFDGVDSITFDGVTYSSGATIEVESGTTHTATLATQTGYYADGWEYMGGMTISSRTDTSITFTVGSNNIILKAYATKNSGSKAMFQSGTVFASKLTDLASANNGTVKAIKKALALPDGFVPNTNNTVSHPDSSFPIYIFYDNTNNAGIIYFYSTANRIIMPPDPDGFFSELSNLTDISGLSTIETDRAFSLQLMFQNDSSLTNLEPIRNWNLQSAYNMERMFEGCTSLTDASAINGWVFSNSAIFTKMFNNAPSHPNWNGTWSSDGTFIPN